MVKPGGTGSRSTEVISARLAPLPPRRSFISIGGLRCLWSKAKTYGMDSALLAIAGQGQSLVSAPRPDEGEDQVVVVPRRGRRTLLVLRRPAVEPSGQCQRQQDQREAGDGVEDEVVG